MKHSIDLVSISLVVGYILMLIFVFCGYVIDPVLGVNLLMMYYIDLNYINEGINRLAEQY